MTGHARKPPASNDSSVETPPNEAANAQGDAVAKARARARRRRQTAAMAATDEGASAEAVAVDAIARSPAASGPLTEFVRRTARRMPAPVKRIGRRVNRVLDEIAADPPRRHRMAISTALIVNAIALTLLAVYGRVTIFVPNRPADSINIVLVNLPQEPLPLNLRETAAPPEPEPEQAPEPDLEDEPEPEPDPDPAEELAPEPLPEPETPVETEPEPELETAPEPEPEPESQPEPEPEPQQDLDLGLTPQFSAPDTDTVVEPFVVEPTPSSAGLDDSDIPAAPEMQPLDELDLSVTPQQERIARDVDPATEQSPAPDEAPLVAEEPDRDLTPPVELAEEIGAQDPGGAEIEEDVVDGDTVSAAELAGPGGAPDFSRMFPGAQPGAGQQAGGDNAFDQDPLAGSRFSLPAVNLPRVGIEGLPEGATGALPGQSGVVAIYCPEEFTDPEKAQECAGRPEIRSGWRPGAGGEDFSEAARLLGERRRAGFAGDAVGGRFGAPAARRAIEAQRDQDLNDFRRSQDGLNELGQNVGNAGDNAASDRPDIGPEAFEPGWARRDDPTLSEEDLERLRKELDRRDRERLGERDNQ
ncbi:MAG: hypothetical protein GC152_13420 [Alphaproteobacteria bacterium]|nr:hypothetical protein [Alphaproteobacteria bacterium]